MHKTTGYIAITVADFDGLAQPIIDQIGLEPTTISQTGQPTTHGRMPRRNYLSYLTEAPDPDADFEEHLAYFSRVIFPKLDGFKAVADRCKIDITIVASAEDRIPSLSVDRDLMRFALALDLIIDIDIYQ